jgi:hypothetical protein
MRRQFMTWEGRGIGVSRRVCERGVGRAGAESRSTVGCACGGEQRILNVRQSLRAEGPLKETKSFM